MTLTERYRAALAEYRAAEALMEMVGPEDTVYYRYMAARALCESILREAREKGEEASVKEIAINALNGMGKPR